MVLLEFEDSFNDLHLIKIIFWFHRALVPQSWGHYGHLFDSSFYNILILIIVIFMRGWVGDVNVANMKILVMVALLFRRNKSLEPIKFHDEFSHLLLKFTIGFISSHGLAQEKYPLDERILFHWPLLKMVKNRKEQKLQKNWWHGSCSKVQAWKWDINKWRGHIGINHGDAVVPRNMG